MRINIGCGMTPTEGWLNFDNSFSLFLSKLPYGVIKLLRLFRLLDTNSYALTCFAKENHIRLCNAAKHIPLPDSSTSVIYSSHMLEHLDRFEVKQFLKECRRVLQPDGMIRIVIPDVDKYIDSYNENRDADALIDGLHLSAMKPRGIFSKFKLIVIGPRHHHWMYSAASIEKLMSSAGFKNIKIIAPGETRLVDCGRLNLRERESESLYLEAEI